VRSAYIPARRRGERKCTTRRIGSPTTRPDKAEGTTTLLTAPASHPEFEREAEDCARNPRAEHRARRERGSRAQRLTKRVASAPRGPCVRASEDDGHARLRGRRERRAQAEPAAMGQGGSRPPAWRNARRRGREQPRVPPLAGVAGEEKRSAATSLVARRALQRQPRPDTESGRTGAIQATELSRLAEPRRHQAREVPTPSRPRRATVAHLGSTKGAGARKGALKTRPRRSTARNGAQRDGCRNTRRTRHGEQRSDRGAAGNPPQRRATQPRGPSTCSMSRASARRWRRVKTKGTWQAGTRSGAGT